MDMGQNIFVQSDDRRVDNYKTLKERATSILKQKVRLLNWHKKPVRNGMM